MSVIIIAQVMFFFFDRLIPVYIYQVMKMPGVCFALCATNEWVTTLEP